MATILIIEDEQAATLVLEIAFKRAGYKTISAKGGFQGLKLAQTERPDLIMLDLMLPGIDGFEICNRLRADPSTADLPVYITSAKSKEADRQLALKMGATGYFTKPYNLQELLETVRAALAAKSQACGLAGTGVAFVGARGGEVSSVIAHTALALAKGSVPVTLVDFRLYSTEHCLLLNVTPRPAVALAQRETLENITKAMVHHPGNLRLLNNLEGSGDLEQISPADVRAVCNSLLAQDGFALAEVPLRPIELLQEMAAHCAQVVLVTEANPPALAAARSALNALERIGLSGQKAGMVLIGPGDTSSLPDLGQVVLATLPPLAGPAHPAFQAVAGHLRDLRKA